MSRRSLAALVLAAALIAACGPAAEPLPPYPTPIPREPIVGAGPPCDIVEWVPLHDIRLMCFEVVLDDVPRPEAAPTLGGMALAADGTLYLLHTAAGEVRALRDADGDGFPEAPPETVASGLALPGVLTAHDGALIVAGPGGITRLDDTNGDGRFETHTLLVDALPYDTGFWPGALAVGPDSRLYVGVGAGCLRCDAGEARPGRLLSFALDGSDEREEATGFYRPGGLAWHPDTGELWLVDGGGPEAPAELNRVVPGGDYGFPACPGDRALSAPDAPECAGTQPPAVLLPVQSAPAAAAFYLADAFALWQGDLLVVLSGSWSLVEPAGYALVALDFAGGSPTGALDTVVPSSAPPIQHRSLAGISIAGRGFFPQHPIGIAITPEGWILVATQEGRVYRARPRVNP